MPVKLRNGLYGHTRLEVGLRSPKGPYTKTIVTKASIHHGGPVGGPRMSFEAGAATWRSWQDFHQNTRGWLDVGYNVGIDGRGHVYQGRPGGVLPAAVGDHNTGMVGIVFMQDGRYHALNKAQRATLRTLFRHGIPEWNIPPLHKLVVKGHKEYLGHESNACPGELIMKHLAWRRERAKEPAKPKPKKPPKYPGKPLRRDSRGKAVKAWQTQMRSRGWRLAVDGHFGLADERVCEQFQRDKGLVVDGVVGPKTWEATWKSPVT